MATPPIGAEARGGEPPVNPRGRPRSCSDDEPPVPRQGTLSCPIASPNYCNDGGGGGVTSTDALNFPLENVTRSNFEPALESLRDHVRAADFVAVDLEMTGVTSVPWRESFEFDRYDVRYLKVKDSAEKFAVVQFGVCPFRWDPQELCFVAHPRVSLVFAFFVSLWTRDWN
ncbi:hypothetical protein NL676_035209 [Syzygium grande]|nr:hypothetical protein NL676_035209 [Syzygium grande]